MAETVREPFIQSLVADDQLRDGFRYFSVVLLLSVIVNAVCGHAVLHVPGAVPGSQVQFQVGHLGHGLCDLRGVDADQNL